MGVPAPVHQAGIDRDQGSEGCPVRIPFLVRVAAIHTQSLPTGPVSSGQDERVRGSTGLMWSGEPCAPLPSGLCVLNLLGIDRHTHRLAGNGERDGPWFPPRIRNEQAAEDRCLLTDPRTLDGDVEPPDRFLVCRSVTIGQEQDDPAGVVDRAGRVGELVAKPGKCFVVHS